LPVLQSQNLKIAQLFLRFCSIRTGKDKPNLSAKLGSYYVPIPEALNDWLKRRAIKNEVSGALWI